MMCNGKCYLAKQLKKAEQQNQDKSSPIPNLKLKSVDWIAIEPIVAVPEAVEVEDVNVLFMVPVVVPEPPEPPVAPFCATVYE